jgi:hypothetical protein
VNPKHLFLGTHQDNAKDARDKGLDVKKLTWGDVNSIKQGLEMGKSTRELADSFGVTTQTIRYIGQGKRFA